MPLTGLPNLRHSLLTALLLLAPGAFAEAQGRAGAPAIPSGRVVADSFWSPIIGTRKRFLIYLPPTYLASRGTRYPVAYYLHGHSGREDDWNVMGMLPAVMDTLVAGGMREMIVVMPDGDDGWYTTWNALGNLADCTRRPPARESAATYCVPWPKYDDYIARDLVAHVDSTFRTHAARAHRGLAGLSMGGYGAVTLALRYDDVYSAAASHSGVLGPLLGLEGDSTEAADIAVLLGRWPEWLLPSMRLAFGFLDLHGWTARDPARMVQRAHARGASMPALFVDIGVEDPFLHGNRSFARSVRAAGDSIVYRELPGKHDWPYWRLHVRESLAWLAARLSP